MSSNSILKQEKDLKLKFDEISILKSIAAIMVIMIHISANPIVSDVSGGAFWFFSLVNQISAPAVPIFIFASGFVLFNKYADSEINYFLFIKKRLNKILIPYFAWSTIYYIIFHHSLVKINIMDFFLAYIKALILGTSMYHLYFIVIITQFYLLLPFIIKIVKKLKPLPIFLFFIFLNLIISLKFKIPYYDRFFLPYFVYFIMGAYFSKNLEFIKSKSSKYIKLIILSFILLTFYNSWRLYSTYSLHIQADYNSIKLALLGLNYTISRLTGILSFYFYALHIKERNIKIKNLDVKKFLLKITPASFYIYLSHPLFIYLIDKALINRTGFGSVIKSFLYCIFIFTICVPISILYSKKQKKLSIRK